MSTAARVIWSTPPLLLGLTVLFWSGNFVVGRAVNGVVPPVALAFYRWAGALLLVLPFAWRPLRRDVPVLRRDAGTVLLLSATGVAAFNTFVYIGLQTTPAINALLLNTAMPVLILVASRLLFGEAAARRQVAGLALSLAGVALVIARGSPAALLQLSVAPGDLWVLLAVACYALYSVLLRRRPAVHPLSFIGATFALGTLMLLPFYLAELLVRGGFAATPAVAAAIVYVAVFPSVLAYLCFNRGVALAGANRAGQYVHLMPVFGSILAFIFLGERLYAFHLAGMALIAAGIALAARAPVPE